MASHHAGMRLSFGDALCTVRYCGPLPDQNGNWLGVEWDDPDRGKHDGQYKGKRLFGTLSRSPKCASFVRATRTADKPRSFLEALRHKYAEDGLEKTTSGTDASIEISGKFVEEVGFEQIRKQQALLRDLKIVVLDNLRIRGVDAEAEIATICPNIIELDLSRNLIERWKDIADICAPLTKLRFLRASGLRPWSFNSVASSAFRNVEELHLNDCLLKPDQILDILCTNNEMHTTKFHFPSLGSLSIAGNCLSTFCPTITRSIDLVFPTIKTLIMDSNMFTSLVPLCKAAVQLFPNLTTLSLQHNQISDLNPPESTLEESLPSYPSVTTLNLSHNAIATPATLSLLSQLLPNITSLRVSGNPFFTTTSRKDSHTEDASFMLTLARLPTLKTLNYSAITDKDRMDGELYYLSVAEKSLQTAYREAGSTASDDFRRIQRDWGRYAELCNKYEREQIVDKLAAQVPGPIPVEFGPQHAKQAKKYPPSSLGARLVTITFRLHSKTTATTTTNNNDHDVEKTAALTIPRTIDVYRVKGLLVRKVGREWCLRPLNFSFELVHERHGGMDKDQDQDEEEIPDSTRKIGDWLEDEAREFVIRVKPRVERKEDAVAEAEIKKMDLRPLMEMAGSD